MNCPSFLQIALTFCLILPLISCSNANSQGGKFKSYSSKEFNDYWYAGDAELSRYELEQARYGEIHSGDAVLIFVTEDFDTKKQVKFERAEKTKDVKSILKLNFTRKFYTGIYPYSMMSSIFTPVDRTLRTLKVTTSAQEWCGHSYSQLNYRNGRYAGRLHSYFMEEGDREFTVDDALLEDEIWTMIRLNPNDLPTGSISIIPGTMFLRLKHVDFGVQKATASMEIDKDTEYSNKPVGVYRVDYLDLDRSLEITFESEFPYSILAWEEKVHSGFGPNVKPLTTRAVRTHSIKNAYWGKHDVADGELRKKLGLN